jgi:hypothetical protein
MICGRIGLVMAVCISRGHKPLGIMTYPFYFHTENSTNMSWSLVDCTALLNIQYSQTRNFQGARNISE